MNRAGKMYTGPVRLWTETPLPSNRAKLERDGSLLDRTA